MSGFVKEQLSSLTSMNLREGLLQIVNLGLIVTSALMIWKTLILVTGSESPVVVVLSGSMEPGFYRGDILFLHMGRKPVRAGEIVVFNLEGRDIPIVHRAIKVHERARPHESVPYHIDILTKGDNNKGDDRALYNDGALPDCLCMPLLNLWKCVARVASTKSCHGLGAAAGQDWLHKKHIMGRVVGYLPYVGMVTIIMNDYPYVKYVLIGVLALFVLTSKE